MVLQHWSAIVFSLFLATLPMVVQGEEVQPSYLLCRNKKTIRTLRMDPADKEEPCTTTYTKSGVDKVVGSGRHTSTCVKIMGNIRENLEQAGWTCKDISASSISSSMPTSSGE